MAPGRNTSKGTPAIGRTAVRRKSGIGVGRGAKRTGPLQGLRLNNQELAVRVEETEQSLHRSHSRNVDMHAKCASLNEELVLCRKEVKQLKKQLDAERTRSSQLAACITTMKRVVDDSFRGLVQPMTPVVTKGEATTSPAVSSALLSNQRVRMPSSQGSGKAHEIRARRAEFNVPTLSQSPIAHKPSTDNIEEEQAATPSHENRLSIVPSNSASFRLDTSTEDVDRTCSPLLSMTVEPSTIGATSADMYMATAEQDIVPPCAGFFDTVATDCNASTSDKSSSDSEPLSPFGVLEGIEQSSLPCDDAAGFPHGAGMAPDHQLMEESALSHLSMLHSESNTEHVNDTAQKPKRRRSISSYKEPGLRVKMRSEDPNLYAGYQHAKVKKRRRSCSFNFQSSADKENV